MKRMLPLLAISLLFVLFTSSLVYWLMMKGLEPDSLEESPGEVSTIENSSSGSTTTAGQVQTIASASKPNPPPPSVFWSELTYQLFSLEQERVEFISTLLEKFPPLQEQLVELPPPPNEERTVVENTEEVNFVSLSAPSSPPVDLNDTTEHPLIEPEQGWTTIGQQVIELEQLRESIIALIASKVEIERHPSTTLP